MGEALIKGLLATGAVEPKALLAADVRPERLAELEGRHRIQTVASNVELVRRSDVVVLAVKPQIMEPALREIAPAVTPAKLLISVAAGVPLAALRRGLGKDARLVRVMPNTPALVLSGATAIAGGDGLQPGDLDVARAIFGAVGTVVTLAESALDAVTGLSGSGPAYVAIVVEALADGGVRMGLDRATALALATQTVLGSARLLAETGLHPGALKDMVSSPGGTTIAGIAALEEGGLRSALIRAVEAATRRSQELGRGPA
jgi:pyrroline-5-carboxylate reductase